MKLRRLISGILASAVALSVISFSSFAAEETTEKTPLITFMSDKLGSEDTGVNINAKELGIAVNKTYKMSLNVTFGETGGFRIRWSESDSAKYIPSDDKVVKGKEYQFGNDTLEITDTTLPFSVDGFAKGETKDFTIVFTPAKGLTNFSYKDDAGENKTLETADFIADWILIRGMTGGKDFTVNSVKIEEVEKTLYETTAAEFGAFADDSDEGSALIKPSGAPTYKVEGGKLVITPPSAKENYHCIDLDNEYINGLLATNTNGVTVVVSMTGTPGKNYQLADDGGKAVAGGVTDENGNLTLVCTVKDKLAKNIRVNAKNSADGNLEFTINSVKILTNNCESTLLEIGKTEFDALIADKSDVIMKSGTPTFAVTDNKLVLSDRKNDYDAVDFSFDALADFVDEYGIVTLKYDLSAAAGSTLFLSIKENYADFVGKTVPNGDKLTLTYDVASECTLRLKAPNSLATFAIESIKVYAHSKVLLDEEVAYVIPLKLAVDPTKAAIQTGKTANVAAVITYAAEKTGNATQEKYEGKDIVWETDKEAVATVKANETDPTKAVITAVAEGSAKISVTINGKKATCTVTVTNEAPAPSTGGGDDSDNAADKPAVDDTKITDELAKDKPVIEAKKDEKLTNEQFKTIITASKVVEIKLSDSDYKILIDPAKNKNVDASKIKDISLNMGITKGEKDAPIVKDSTVKLSSSLVITPTTKDAFGITLTLAIPKKDLTAAGIDTTKKMYVYYIKDNNSIEALGEFKMTGDEFCIDINHASSYVISNDYVEIGADGNPKTGVPFAAVPAVAAGAAVLAVLVIKKKTAK